MLKSRIRPFASALVLATMTAAGAAMVATPAVAQKKDEAPKPPKPSRKATKGLGDIQKALGAKDYDTAKAKIAELEAAGDLTEEDLYFVSNFKFQAAAETQDNALLEKALEQMAVNKYTTPTEVPKIRNNLIALAIQAQDYPKAIQRSKEALAADPANVEIMLNMGRIYFQQDDYQNAIASFRQAAEVAKSQGQTVEENVYKLIAQAAIKSENPANIQSAMLDLVRNYPSQTNWRDALVLYRSQPGIGDPQTLDSFRLQWVTNALDGQRDYIEMAELAMKRGLPAEAKAVLEKGAAANVFGSAKALADEMLASARTRTAADLKELPSLEAEARSGKTGDLAASTVGQGYLSHGNYAKAVEFYKLGLDKGVKNKDEATLQYGMALLGAGQAQEALAAFQSVGGNLKPLADLWAAHANNVVQGR